MMKIGCGLFGVLKLRSKYNRLIYGGFRERFYFLTFRRMYEESTARGAITAPLVLFRCRGGLLRAQFFIEFQPQAAVVFDYFGSLLNTPHVHFQFLRSHVEFCAIRRFHQNLFQPWQRENVFDMVVVEYQHQLCRKRPHPVVHHDRIMDVEFHTVIDIVERVVEIDDRLRRELCRQTHVAAPGKRILRLFEQVVAERAERVEMEFGVGMGFGKVDRVLRAAKPIVVAAMQ